MTATTTEHDLPYLDTHTHAFLDRPNEFLGSGPDRLRVAQGRSGAELFGYETVRAVFRDDRISPRTPQVFLDKGVTGGPILEYIVDGNLNLTWKDTHDRLRPIMMRGFRPRRITEIRPVIRELAESLIDRLLERDSANIVTEFAHHLSIRTIAQFIGIPLEDVPEFDTATVELRLLGQEPFWPGVPRLEAALETVRAYSERIVEMRRAQRREDFISDLVDARQEGEDLCEAELVWNIAGILLAGHDTTRYQLSSLVRGLAESGQWEALAAAPQHIPTAIVEGMRMYPATPRQVRVVQAAAEIEGRSFLPGELLTLNLTGAGRDPSVFPDPDRFMLDRPGTKYDIGFGYGAHYCLGFAVAKAEMEEGIALLLRRLRDVELDGPVEVKPGGVIAGPEVVPVRYAAR
jgi:cytochrome P450